MRALLDISRTVARARLPAPTGIDRVERAYIDWALARDALFLASVDRRFHLVEARQVRALVAWLDGEGEAPARDWRARLRPQRDQRLGQAQSLIRRDAVAVAADPSKLGDMLKARMQGGGVYLNVGHDNLSAPVMQAIGAAGLARVVLIQDTIPLDYPQYARKGTPDAFRAKLDAALAAELILLNSQDTMAHVAAHAGGKVPPMAVAPLGITLPSRPGRPLDEAKPCFVCLGTIEPRKNHALLLDLWRQFGDGAPAQLHIIGRRGWENAQVFEALDTAPFMGHSVFELGALPEGQTHTRLAGASALLFPSHAEGYGLPLAEALALGCPVIASDLPALREVGGAVPEWLAPGDIQGWRAAVEAYADENSPERAAQLARLRDWRAPTWIDHFAIVDKQLETILVQSGQGG